MQDLEQERREALLRRSQSGDRARVALGELEKFIEGEKAQILSKFLKVRNANEAFELAAEYRAAMKFEGSARAAIANGDAADGQLTSEE
ncbi:MAG: hypothetical protein LBF92_03700 [Synergistaceae bacterium]|jgi:hypothetical protein|nr:hypothetical protein [Synergistaceae bacterium]